MYRHLDGVGSKATCPAKLGYHIGERRVGCKSYRGAGVFYGRVFDGGPLVAVRGVDGLAAVEGGKGNAVALTDVVVRTGLGRGQGFYRYLHAVEGGATVFVPAEGSVPRGNLGRYPRHGVGYSLGYLLNDHGAVLNRIYGYETFFKVVPNRVVSSAGRIGGLDVGSQIFNGQPYRVDMPIGTLFRNGTQEVVVGRIFARRVNRVPAVSLGTVSRQADAVAEADTRVLHNAHELSGLRDVLDDNRVAFHIGRPQALVVRVHLHHHRVAVLEEVERCSEDRVVAAAVVLQHAVYIPVVGGRIALCKGRSNKLNGGSPISHAHVVPIRNGRTRGEALIERQVALIGIRLGTLGRYVEYAVVVQVVNYAVGQFNADAVAYLIAPEAAFMNTAFVNFKVATVGVGGILYVLIAGIFRMHILGRSQTNHNAYVGLTYHAANGTVVVNELLGGDTAVPVNVGIGPASVAAGVNSIGVAPLDGFFDNRVANERVGFLTQGDVGRLTRQHVDGSIYLQGVARHRTLIFNRHPDREDVGRGTVVVGGFQGAVVGIFGRVALIGNAREALAYLYPVFEPVVFGAAARVARESGEGDFREFANRV